MQCKARYCREKKELTFPLKSGYFTELRCPNLASGDGPDPELCERCVVKAGKPFRTACQQGQYQGKIDEPYFEASWLFGSERFIRFNSIPGNALSPEDYARAEAAQKIARQGSEMKTKAEPKIKVTAKPKVKISEKPVAKTVISPAPSQPPKPLIVPVGVELLDEPLEAIEVKKIKLKRIESEGTTFWLNTNDRVVFACGTNDSVGKKIGIWNPDEESIESEFT